MKIVDRKTFLAMPPNTLFSKYQRHVFGELHIKGETLGADFYMQQIADAVRSNDSNEFFDILEHALTTGESVGFDFDCQSRDGMFDEDQLFAVWEDGEIGDLILRLLKCRQR